MSTPTQGDRQEAADVETPSIPDALDGVEALAEDQPLDLDTKFELLRNQRRRIVVAHLVETGERLSMSDLAEHVAAVENDCSVRKLSSAERKRAYVGLYQCHLPKLADAGVIDYNRDRGHAEATPAAEDLLAYVDRDGDASGDWGRRYQTAAVGAGGLFGVALLASAVASVPWVAVAALSILLVGGVATAHARREGVLVRPPR